ncbi:hypothetical protein KXD40_009527 [Peronospora effusa]|uniref:COMM domain-containing protein n=1 Tax=Peronospora effusa TaxID=542832 RepID=A0A3M6VH12_9STRA|nr:hypothetical protein DD238_003163 [Peronospora effusa]RQM15509.1 hypothetical protein DD237_002570 [Peronospora effusa]UIZ23757.1 hypothetical protein KXD40_009527 [Peronospora effusa]CAI5701178.1 unnamed protein product [Peronospora effusa]
MRHATAPLSSSTAHVLHDINEAFVSHHLDSAMQLAIALYSKDDAIAERTAESITDMDRQAFLTLAVELRRLIEIAVRQHLTFLLPSLASNEVATSLKTEQMRQHTLLQNLPAACQLRFQHLLELHWNALTQTGKSATFSLPRVQQLHWKVKNDNKKGILLRLQTSDGETRTIYVPVQQFHQLRHSAATVLQEMNEVEAHPMMRLAYMEQTSSPVS